MEFVVSPPDIVRSITQAWLLKDWMRSRGACRIPASERPGIAERAGIADNLLLMDVMDGEGPTRFLIHFCGSRVLEYCGVSCPTQGQGRFLDEALPAAYRQAALSSFHEVVSARAPVYTVADLRDRAGRIVHFERLLLPFGRDGTAVDRILASIEAVSPEGEFQSWDLMLASAPPAFAFCAIIDTRAPVGGDGQ